MDKKKMYIVIAVLAAILVACLVLAFVLKGGSEDAKNPDTTQGTGSGETQDTGDETPDDTGSNDSGNSGTGDTGNGGTGNGSTGNGGTGNGGTGNGGNGNATDPTTGTSEPTTSGSDIDISVELEVVPNDFDTPATGGNQGSSTPTNPTEGEEETPNNVISFKDLLDAGQSGN